MLTIKAVSKYLVYGVLGLTLTVACKSKPKDEGTTTGNADTAIDSTAMSFDALGSDSGKINGLSSINFDYDKSNLSADAKQKLAGNAEWMKKNPQAKVQIEGHCDARGTIEYNLALGERRANSVKAYMTSLGVNSDRLSTISYGKEKPLATGDSDADHAKNRRGNFVPVMM